MLEGDNLILKKKLAFMTLGHIQGRAKLFDHNLSSSVGSAISKEQKQDSTNANPDDWIVVDDIDEPSVPVAQFEAARAAAAAKVVSDFNSQQTELDSETTLDDKVKSMHVVSSPVLIPKDINASSPE